MVRKDGAETVRRGRRTVSIDRSQREEGEAPHLTVRDEFAYLGDMIGEMSAIAARLGNPTLAGILELAHRETELELSRRASRCGGSATQSGPSETS